MRKTIFTAIMLLGLVASAQEVSQEVSQEETKVETKVEIKPIFTTLDFRKMSEPDSTLIFVDVVKGERMIKEVLYLEEKAYYFQDNVLKYLIPFNATREEIAGM